MTKTIEERAIEFIQAHVAVIDARRELMDRCWPKEFNRLIALRANRLRGLSFAVFRSGKVKR